MEPVEILLIEDNPNDAELILRAFRKRNLSAVFHVLKDGAEAADFLFGAGKSQVPGFFSKLKVIFLDLKLPKVSGLELLAKIKADTWLKEIPVVVLTSSEEDRDIVESYRLGANSYVVKPVDYDKFFGAICDVGLYWFFINRPPRQDSHGTGTQDLSR